VPVEAKLGSNANCMTLYNSTKFLFSFHLEIHHRNKISAGC